MILSMFFKILGHQVSFSIQNENDELDGMFEVLWHPSLEYAPCQAPCHYWEGTSCMQECCDECGIAYVDEEEDAEYTD